jgi:osmotically-inducible protein OsmY
MNPAVSEHLVDVSTDEGVVTLSGHTDNLLARDRAVQIARSTKGVRAVVNRIVVRPIVRSDKEVREDVLAALKNDPAADKHEVDVKVNDSIVTLTGTVESWAERRLVTEVVKGVKGVSDIRNKLAVQFEMTRPDSEIRADVERMLEIGVVTAPRDIEVTVKDGHVELSGVVGSPAEEFEAAQNAWVNGVKSVDTSGLTIEWWAKDKLRPRYEVLTDAQIKEAVRDALRYDPRVSSFSPRIDVQAGVVWLTGTVRNMGAKLAAKQTALNTVGVRRVVNLLSVRPPKLIDDDIIEERVRAALIRDPYVDRFDIGVAVLNGKVYLTGSVSTWFEKRRAEMIAARVRGVPAVSSGIALEPVWQVKSDQELRDDVITQLKWARNVDTEDVSVEVEKGTVILRGEVDNWAEWRSAQANAMQAGPEGLINKLTVTEQEPTAKP